MSNKALNNIYRYLIIAHMGKFWGSEIMTFKFFV